ncbi:Hint domain-containing protein [Spirosoma arcticum]
MKNNLLSFLLFLACATTTQLLSQRVWAQTATAVGMTLDQLKAIKAIKIANLDKDTYLKSGAFILDRYEERPAYVFNYTDGITRKIYLYKIFSAADTKDLGLLALYQNGKTNEVKPFVIPGASADRAAWDAYIDDLKYVGEKEPGLMSTLAFVLSREMAGLLEGGSGKTAEGGTKKKEEFNFCFAPDAPVTLPDGSAKAISAVAVGDLILGYDTQIKTFAPTRVTHVDTHQSNGFALVGVWLAPANELTAGNQAKPAQPVLLEATPNHPVLTATGRKSLGNMQTGELLYRFENGKPVAYRVVRAESSVRSVKTVYTLTTEVGAYVIAETVVLDK